MDIGRGKEGEITKKYIYTLESEPSAPYTVHRHSRIHYFRTCTVLKITLCELWRIITLNNTLAGYCFPFVQEYPIRWKYNGNI